MVTSLSLRAYTLRNRAADLRFSLRCDNTRRAALSSQCKVSTCGISEQCCASDYPSRSDSSDAEWHTSALFTPLVAFLKANLSLVNVIVTAYPIPFYCLMAFFPRMKLTKDLLTNARCLIPLAVMYAVLLCTSWTPESASLLFPGDLETAMAEAMAGKPGLHFVPTIAGICQLLSAPLTAVSAWAHLQFIAFFCARYIWMDGLVKQVTTVHSVLLCAALPPLGFLSHIFTCFFTRARRGDDNESSAVWPAASPAADQGWGASPGGCGTYSTDRGRARNLDGTSTRAQTPETKGDGPSNNGAHVAFSRKPGAATENSSGVQAAKAEQPGKSFNFGFKRKPKKDASWLTVLEPEYVERSEREK